MFRITFWGVRGSIPTPGPTTVEIGGNTSCVEVQCESTRLIFDAGTGLRALGAKLAAEMPTTVHLFFSHVHWDHIQGFPFFIPAFAPGNTIHMYGAANSMGTVETALAGQMEYPNFPVKLSDLPSEMVFHHLVETGPAQELEGGVTVTFASGNHPGGVLAYRVDFGGRAVMYATDTEHSPDGLDERLVGLARDADVLIYDSMYTPEEYEGKGNGPARIGWGHSTFVVGAEIAKAAGAKKLVLFHHDPDQDDAAVRDKERRAQEIFPNSVAAHEGLQIDL